MMNEKLLKPKEVAKMLNFTTGHLANWRYKDTHAMHTGDTNTSGLKWVKLPNGTIRYKESEVMKWIESQSVESKTEENSNI